MTDTEQREAARQFANRWNGKGKEDEDGRSFWIDLLSNVLGMENVTEKEKTISTLAEKLSIAEEKGKGYDDISRAEKEAQENIRMLERKISEQDKDYAIEKRELQTEMEQKLNAAAKDAELEVINAVSKKEKEMNTAILQLERENAKLQAKIEMLEGRLQEKEK